LNCRALIGFFPLFRHRRGWRWPEIAIEQCTLGCLFLATNSERY
jgi:hypothetical protein